MSALLRTTPLGRTAVVLAVLLATASGCVGSGKTAKTNALDPFPDQVKIVSDTTAGCREGESGFDYRFLVVGPADLSSGSALLQHVRARGFVPTVLVADDLPWVTVGYEQPEDRGIRFEAGTLDRYLSRQTPHTGPAVESIPKEVRDQASNYVLIALRPTDFGCATPL